MGKNNNNSFYSKTYCSVLFVAEFYSVSHVFHVNKNHKCTLYSVGTVPSNNSLLTCHEQTIYIYIYMCTHLYI